ncbi:hypothetical protein [Alkalinema sp. FACHB-956]|uniref:hypothetical protein n=1 Tax=Alkalinema sp. FACHB-956 TaxID=2692768 RepID=UPI001687DFF4|nr:hypothetical protein [Alkalinema sp. FACHB-956]MBD2325873.1 hypothetical protein [Alkalinema sp. FACHB-956]
MVDFAASQCFTVQGTIVPGYQVASGRSPTSPYPAGTLQLQLPFFQARGLDLSNCFLGTLNVSIAPHTFEILQPIYTFPNVQWVEGFASETFSFCHCGIMAGDMTYLGWVYYPHPETKLDHFQDASILEVVAPLIPDLSYGDRVQLSLDPQAIALRCPKLADDG